MLRRLIWLNQKFYLIVNVAQRGQLYAEEIDSAKSKI
jgi:hypothetical protein